MPSSRRCVFGCVTKGLTVHSFPNPREFPERFRTWVDLAGDQLKNLSNEEIYPRKKVCDKHFKDCHRNRNNRLNALAIPSLHLPGTYEKQNICMDAEEGSAGNSNMSSRSNVPSAALCISGPHEDKIISLEVEAGSAGKSNMPSQNNAPSKTLCLPGPHEDKIISLEVEAGSAGKSNMPSQNNAPSKTLCLPDAVTSIMRDHNYCSPTIKKRKMTTQPTAEQVCGKAFITKKKQGSRKKTFGLSYYKETETKTRNLRREILRLRKTNKSFKSRLESALKLSNSKAFQSVTANMTVPAKIFTGMQFREAKKKPKGRRFTLEEKILSLSFYKRSPRAYTLLHKSFVLPSSKSLRNLLGKIKIRPGVNKHIFKKIQDSVAGWNDDDRLCILMFDEMSINPQVHYDANNDELKGFSTIGKKKKIADHALTFMVRGIKKNYKQPVAYYFTQNLNKIELKSCIKEVVQHVKNTGLKIVATVCDQSPVNVGAIDSLIQDTKEMYIKKGQAWRNDIFMVNMSKIIPIYDVPHLIKGIRNNLISKDLKYVDHDDGNKEKILKWEYFQRLYEADKSQGELRYLLKITEEHVNPEKINKMKVKSATQLFSHTVAVTAHHLTTRGELDPACNQITPFVKIMDNLFDSLNCNTFGVLNGKTFRAGVKRNSPHHKLWEDSLKFLKQVTFLEKKKSNSKMRVVEKVVPSVKKFIKTIEGMQAIWKVLHEKYSLDTMLCRNLNQDPIENFFGSVRSLGARNVSPNTIGFEGAFKSLLLNNFSTTHSIKFNCEEDVCNFIQSVDFFIKECDSNFDVGMTEESKKLEEIELNEELLNRIEIIEGICQKTYVCGWVLKTCSKLIKTCKNCRSQLFVSEHIPAHGFIKEKEYSHKNWLCYPSMECIKCFNDISNVTVNVLKRNVDIYNVKRNVKSFNDIFTDYSIFDCTKHKNSVQTMFENLVINVTIYSWCRSINRILSGKISYDGEDEIKMSAQIYYNKHKHNKNKK